MITSNNPKLTIEDINLFEINHSILFPIEYKNFLLNYNGGTPNLSLFKIIGNEENYENVLNKFYGIGVGSLSLENILDYLDDLVEIGFLPIANDPGGNQICIGISEENYGKIYFWEHEMEIELENLLFVSNSFQELLENLH